MRNFAESRPHRVNHSDITEYYAKKIWPIGCKPEVNHETILYTVAIVVIASVNSSHIRNHVITMLIYG